MNIKTVEVVEFDDGYFSFAFGNEIALILKEHKGEFWILNCDSKLFDVVKEKVASETKEDLVSV